jgi:hypothetical protein
MKALYKLKAEWTGIDGTQKLILGCAFSPFWYSLDRCFRRSLLILGLLRWLFPSLHFLLLSAI